MTTAANDHQQSVAIDNVEPATISDVVKLVQQSSGTRRPSHPPPLARVNSGPGQQARFIPSVSLDPGNIIHGVDNYDAHAGYVQCAVDALNEIHTGLTNLSNAREQLRKDPSKNESLQILILSKEAEKLQDRCTRKVDSALAALAASIAFTDAELSKPIQAAADNSISGELRALVRGMNDEQRNEFIAEAMRDNDTKVLQAVLGAPAALSGLSRQKQAHHSRTYLEMTQPALAARLQVLRATHDMLGNRSPLMLTEIERCLGARWDVIAKLRKASSEAERALLLVNSPAA